jgi:SlyX protein
MWMEERVVELEMRLAFQDDAIQHLNRTVTDQQQQIDALEQRLEAFRQRLQSLTSSPRKMINRSSVSALLNLITS